IEGVINVQHNCHDSKCDVQLGRPVVIEQKLSKSLEHCVGNVDTGKFIINSGLFHSAELHQAWAEIPFVDVGVADWTTALKDGIDQWTETMIKKQEPNHNKRQKGHKKFDGWVVTPALGLTLVHATGTLLRGC
ncbi:hypothetical protein DFH28DRAFT_1197652, partial [Melampsora americana]